MADQVDTFTEILRQLQAGLINQTEAQRQVDALQPDAQYIKDQALAPEPRNLVIKRNHSMMWK